MAVSGAVALGAGALVGLGLGAGAHARARGLGYRYPEEREMRAPAHWWLYPLGTLLGAGIAWQFWDRPATMVVLVLLLLPMLLLAAIDQDVHRLPDRITKPLYPIVALALLVPAVVEGDWSGYLRALIAAVLGFGLYFLLAIVGRGAFGWGDVKLAGVLGMPLGWVSWTTLGYGLVAGFFLAGLWALVLLLTKRVTRKDFIALGPFIIVGALGVLVAAP